MSLILEALRKSEAERQRGRAPGLFVEQVPVRSRAKRAPLVWPWLAVAAAVAVLLTWAWWQGARPSNATGRAASEATQSESPAAVTAPANAVPAIDSPPGPRVAVPATAVMPSPAAAAPRPTPATVAPAVSETAAPFPTAAPVAAALPAPKATLADPAPAREPAPAPGTSASAMPVPLDTDAAALAPATTSEPPLPTVASLPASERALLPALKLSMHVYTDDSTQRFVILDGKRLREGASPADGVVLEQIRRDGIVLAVNGQRVLLTRP